MRNKNIFIRKETAFAVVERGGPPVFANVVGFHDGLVHYSVDYPEPAGKGSWRWHYADQPNEARSGTYIKPLDDFLARFSPDYENEFSNFVN